MPKLKKLFSPAPLGHIQMFLFILIELLLIFGKEFSKFHVAGPFYLYDSLFILLSLAAGILFFRRPDKTWNWPILLILGLSVIYAGYSFSVSLGPVNYLIRQYALFVYMGGMYLLFFSYISPKANEYNIKFIILMGIAAFFLQIGYHIYNLIFKEGFMGGFFSQFNYYTLLGIMALFVFEAWLLVYVNKWWKWLVLLLIFFLTLTLGHHSSVILATLMVFGCYLFLHSGTFIKLVLGIAAIAVPVALYYLVPSYFQDVNALWRLIYWKYAMKDIILNNYGVIGHGFGQKYITQEAMDALRNMIASPWFEARPEEQYITPMHNSFITIGYHIGFVFVFLLLIPLRKMFVYFFNRRNREPSSQKDFIVLSLMGVFVWTNFHVVLELPHSSAFFWLIYFTAIYLFNFSTSSKTNES